MEYFLIFLCVVRIRFLSSCSRLISTFSLAVNFIRNVVKTRISVYVISAKVRLVRGKGLVDENTYYIKDCDQRFFHNFLNFVAILSKY